MTTEGKIMKIFIGFVTLRDVIYIIIIPQKGGNGTEALGLTFHMSLEISYYKSEADSDMLRYIWETLEQTL